MAKDYATSFYNSGAWKKRRQHTWRARTMYVNAVGTRRA